MAEHKGDFSFQITEISRFVKAENNAELWKSVYGEAADIKDEAGFRKAIAEGLAEQLKGALIISLSKTFALIVRRRLAS